MLMERMIRAARLDPELYYEVERDPSAMGQAFLVVLIVALFPLILSLLPLIGSGLFGLRFLFEYIISAVGYWLVWSAVAVAIGARLGGRASMDGVMRPVAFAYTPGLLRIFTLAPALAWPVTGIVWIWTGIAAVIAVREAMHFDTRKAVMTAVVTTVIVAIIDFILCKLTGAAHSTLGYMLAPLRQ